MKSRHCCVLSDILLGISLQLILVSDEFCRENCMQIGIVSILLLNLVQLRNTFEI